MYSIGCNVDIYDHISEYISILDHIFSSNSIPREILLLDIFITYLYYMCRSIVGSIALFLQRTLLRGSGCKKKFLLFFVKWQLTRICSRLICFRLQGRKSTVFFWYWRNTFLKLAYHKFCLLSYIAP